VHDPERATTFALRLVCGVQAFERVERDAHGDTWRHRLGSLEQPGLKPRERWPVHVLHDQEELTVGPDHVERRRDVGVSYARDDACLVDQHRRELVGARARGVEALDRDDAREPSRTEDPPEMNGGHSAGADLVADHVTPDDERLGLGRSGGSIIRNFQSVSSAAAFVEMPASRPNAP
jgi:hypothetical protein